MPPIMEFKMLTTLVYFNTFMNDFENSANIDAIKNNCIEGAEAIVSEYLGYPLEKKRYVMSFQNIYNDFIIVPAYINTINELKIYDMGISEDDIVVNKVYITIKNYWNYKGIQVNIDFYGGFEAATLPPLIKITICEIATLLYLQTNKNIGMTGIAAPDGMGRTFINYTNFDKYLKKISGYKR